MSFCPKARTFKWIISANMSCSGRCAVQSLVSIVTMFLQKYVLMFQRLSVQQFQDLSPPQSVELCPRRPASPPPRLSVTLLQARGALMWLFHDASQHQENSAPRFPVKNVEMFHATNVLRYPRQNVEVMADKLLSRSFLLSRPDLSFFSLAHLVLQLIVASWCLLLLLKLLQECWTLSSKTESIMKYSPTKYLKTLLFQLNKIW